MQLKSLNFAQLTELAASIEALRAAGSMLHGAGYLPFFDLTPGKIMSIEINVRMPTAPTMPEQDPPRPVAEAAPEAAGPADQAARWTDEEDARLIAVVAREMFAGSSKTAAIDAAAQELGRPVPGTGFRLRKLGPVVLEEETRRLVTAAVKAVGEAEVVPPEMEAAPEAPAPDPVAQFKAALVEAAATDPLTCYLAELPRDTWSIEDDRDLMQMTINGASIDMIAAELGRSAKEIRARFDLLLMRKPGTAMTGHGRGDVLAALEHLLVPLAAE